MAQLVSQFQEINVEFEGRNPIDSDYDGIRQLLGQLLLKADINFGDLANLIISQNYIGSVVQQSEIDEEDDSDEDMDEGNLIFGITSAINISNKQDNTCVQKLVAHIIQRAEKYSDESIVKTIRDHISNTENPVGIIINERFCNIPAQIAVPLLENLHSEIKRAVNKKMPYKFAYYVMILKLYQTKAKKNKPVEFVYTNEEEEIFSKQATLSFRYSVQDEKDSGLGGQWLEDDPTLIPYREIIMFEADKLPLIVDNIKSIIS